MAQSGGHGSIAPLSQRGAGGDLLCQRQKQLTNKQRSGGKNPVNDREPTWTPKDLGGIFKMPPYRSDLKPLARELRKSMTDAERALWSKVRRKQLNGRIFYRQKAIGSYIADFYCPSVKLVVELDGGQHYTAEGRAKDEIRDKVLVDLGLSVLRFSDVDVLNNMDGVLSVLHERTRNPPCPPLKKRGVIEPCPGS